MKTLEDLEIEIHKSLLELEDIGQNPWTQTKYSLGQRYVLKEKDIGRLYCEAEEILSEDELIQLKEALGIDEHRWQLYKSKFVHFHPEEG